MGWPEYEGNHSPIWWDINELDEKGNPIYGSEAWVVAQIFYWIGIENRSPYWVAKELNKLGIKPRQTKFWPPQLIEFIIEKRCYKGRYAYNTAHYVPNPNRPLGDITAEVKRTIRRAKPEEEHVSFSVPRLISDELWERANQNLDARRGTREQKFNIEALLRHRVYCPKCSKVMAVRRYSDATKYPHFVYYACPGDCRAWKPDRCDMKAGRIDRIDNAVKGKLEMALKNPDWAIMQSIRHTEKKEELEAILAQITQDNARPSRTKEAFQKIHEENIKRSTFADWL